MNRITFTANLLVTPKADENRTKLANRGTDISNAFFEKTRYDNYHTMVLLDSNDNGSDEFILKRNEWEGDTVVSRFRTNFTCDLDKLSNNDAVKRLVDVFELMKIKAEQNKKLKKKIDTRDSIVEKRDKEIRELDTEQKLEFLYEMQKRGLSSDTTDFPELAS